MVQSDANDSNDSNASGAHETNDSATKKRIETGQQLDSDASADTDTDSVTLESGH